MYRCSKKINGFSMIELIVAISLLSFGILAVYSAFANINSVTYVISSRLQAVYLAKEGFEIIRNIRDDNFIHIKNWSQYIGICNNGCQADYKTNTRAETSANRLQNYNGNNFLKMNADGFYSYDSGNDTIFKRKITFTRENVDTAKVSSKVFWKYNGKDYEFETMGYLYNWE